MGIVSEILHKIFGLTLPEQASAQAHLVDDLYNFVMLLSVIGFFGLMGAMVFFMVRYHKSQNDKSAYIPHNALAETLWTVIPTIIFVAIAVWGLWAYYEKEKVPADAMEIKVTGKQWFWEFRYKTDDGFDFTVKDLMYVPIGKTIVTDMTSTDVIHSFYVPSFRVKRDTVPGMKTKVVFTPTMEGDFNIFCAEFCGTSHSKMRGIVRVVSEERYQKWLKFKLEEVKFLKTARPDQRGAKLFATKGCTSCHTTGSSDLIGPGLGGLWEAKRSFEGGGSGVADAAYIRESILEPQAKIVSGFTSAKMNSFSGQITEEEIDDIIEFIKTLK